jgi:hypothetical protein
MSGADDLSPAALAAIKAEAVLEMVDEQTDELDGDERSAFFRALIAGLKERIEPAGEG